MRNLFEFLFVCLFKFAYSNVILDRDLLSEWEPNFRTTNEIFLSGRDIDSIASNTFANLSNLESLHLSLNNLVSLADSSLFASVYNLKELRLQLNLLTRLNASLFNNLPQLEWLDMSLNELNTLDAFMFTNLFFERKHREKQKQSQEK